MREPRAPLSNNAAGRAVKGPVLGRKNFGGCRSLRGLEVAGTLYSLSETAKLVRVDSRAYLRAAAEAGIQGRPPLRPHAYKAQLRSQTISG